MSVSRIGLGVSARRDQRREMPRRRRLGLMLLLSLIVGGSAGVVAFIIIWMPTLFTVFHDSSTPPQISANMLFPPAAPIHQTINVVDPPVYVAPAPVRSGGGGGGGDDGGGGGGTDN